MLNIRSNAAAIVIAALFASHALAQDTKTNLDATLKELEKSKKAQSDIDKRIKRLNKEMESIQSEGVKLAASISSKESEIEKKNASLTVLQREREKKRDVFKSHREGAAKLLQAMVRMQRMPKELVVAMPGKKDDLLRTASALHISFDAAEKEMSEVAVQLRELGELETKISAKKQALKEEKILLRAEQKALEKRLSERQTLQRKLNSEQDSLNARIAKLSRESSSLKDLLGRINKEGTLFSHIGLPRNKPTVPTTKRDKSFYAMKGALPYPTRGQLIHQYGQRKGSNNHYKGHVIRTAPRARITAPYSGNVVFTGRFMDYGNMVIIQHNKAYHSLLSGLSRIDVEPGQRVFTGEPLGVMGNTAKSQELYLELRKNSKAIDPTLWMGNLNRNLAAN